MKVYETVVTDHKCLLFYFIFYYFVLLGIFLLYFNRIVTSMVFVWLVF